MGMQDIRSSSVGGLQVITVITLEVLKPEVFVKTLPDQEYNSTRFQNKDLYNPPAAVKAGGQNPIEIKITEMPELKIQNLLEQYITPKGKKKKIILPKFPDNLAWVDVTIRFVNGDEVVIETKGEQRQVTAVAMGFENQKTKRPNVQWELLKALANHGGEISWADNQGLAQKQIDTFKKRKQMLSDALKSYFKIDDDPFYEYWKDKSYKVKFTLFPETGFAPRKSILESSEADIGGFTVGLEETEEPNSESEDEADPYDHPDYHDQEVEE